MTNKRYWYCGLAAIIIYLLTIIYGGYLYPGYSHVSQDISQLTSTHSPIRGLMNPLLLIYNLLVICFGVGLVKLSNKAISKISSTMIVLVGVLGAIVLLFPINTRGTPITEVGTIHIILVSAISLLTIISNFLFWFAYKSSRLDRLAKISLTAGIGFLLTGPVAAINVMSPYAGLFERIPIGIFLCWVGAVSILFIDHPKLIKHQRQKS